MTQGNNATMAQERSLIFLTFAFLFPKPRSNPVFLMDLSVFFLLISWNFFTPGGVCCS